MFNRKQYLKKKTNNFDTLIKVILMKLFVKKTKYIHECIKFYFICKLMIETLKKKLQL